MPICERCGCEHDGSFGSGRFCSKSCANAHTRTEESKKKTSESIRKWNEKRNKKPKKLQKELKRQLREKEFTDFMNTVRSSSDMKILEYPGIEFGTKYIITKAGKVISTKTRKEMKLGMRNSYYWACLTDSNSKQHCVYVHRLVAYNFIPNPNNYPIINHKDEDPSNNNVDNLEWCTYSYNATYNDAHIKRGKQISETIKRKGGSWNKGKKSKK